MIAIIVQRGDDVRFIGQKIAEHNLPASRQVGRMWRQGGAVEKVAQIDDEGRGPNDQGRGAGAD